MVVSFVNHFVCNPCRKVFSSSFLKLFSFVAVIGFCVLIFSPTVFANNEVKVIDKTVEKALLLTPDLKKGKELYRNCALCHTPEGWGSPGGRFPQIAGQYQTVILKQLADIHKRNRDNPTMFPFSETTFAKGPQALADISAYIEQLPMVPNNSIGLGVDMDKAAELYKHNCKKCHGANGEGDAKEYYPRIQGQHYQYLLRQMLWIKQHKRRNADDKMVKQIEGFSLADISLLADYVSRLRPDKKLLADHRDWRNPDFRSSFMTVPKMQKKIQAE